LHEFYGEPEQAAGFVADHFEVVGFAGAGEAVAPVQVHALAAVQVEQFFGEDLDEFGIVHDEQVLQRFEVDVVCRVYGLWGAEDGVRDGDAAAEDGRVFYVVDTVYVSIIWWCMYSWIQHTATRQCAAFRPPAL
jgi:hypothetical protein